MKITNYGPLPFSGWVRTTTDWNPGAPAGPDWMLGRAIGASAWVIDIHVENLPPGHTYVPYMTPLNPRSALPFPGDPIGYFGGWPKINGLEMQLENVRPDGAAYLFQLHCRVGPMFHVRLWGRWYPDEPAMVHAEVAITASNGAVTDLFAHAPEGISLSWGRSAVFLVPSQTWSTQLLGDEVFGDGQSRIIPVKIVFPHLFEADDFLSLVASLTDSVWACGIDKLYPQGNPIYTFGFDPKKWTTNRFTEARRRMLTFEPAMCGPSPRSANTGAQEDQVFVRGEGLFEGEEGAIAVAYYSALKLGARPCHHLEANGKQADVADHPNCMFWWGRPHFATPDHLGKLEPCSAELWRGWEGPDDEHWLYNTLFAAARLTGSQALQWLLEQQARLFLFSETLPSEGKGGWFTTSPRSARSVGWACWLAVLLWESLEDRSLAARVRDRWRRRMLEIYLPQLSTRPSAVWDPRTNDPRLGQGDWWMPWQQAVGAYFMDVASEMFELPEGRQLALTAAKAVTDRNIYASPSGRWDNYHYHRVDESAHTKDPTVNLFLFGTPLAVATVLRHEPADLRCRSIRLQMLQDAQLSGQTSWLPPEV